MKPVAWMRADGERGSLSTMSVCISDIIKGHWLQANPRHVERYTIPLYTLPQPLTADAVFANNELMAINAGIGLQIYQLMDVVRAIERAHGIGGDA